MHRATLSIVFVLLIFGQIVSAQEPSEDPIEGWEIVERCVGDPIVPPADWTFDGTILASGWAGIHGINADWDVPRVQMFYDDWSLFTELSPDDEWLVTTTAIEGFCPNCFGRTWRITELRVLSTLNAEEFVIPINVGYEYGLGYQTRIQMRWLNNNEVVFFTNGYSIYGRVYGLERINPFIGSIEPLNFPINALSNDFDFHPAPNWEIGVYNPEQLPDVANWGLYDLTSGELLLDVPDLRAGAFLTDALVWSNDSSKFVGITEIESNKYLIFYDHSDGQIVNIYELPDGSSPHHIEWSSDGNYVAFIQSVGSFLDDILIIDIANEAIIETCIQSATMHWSPVSN